jgi:hypothetical protein
MEKIRSWAETSPQDFSPVFLQVLPLLADKPEPI